jgi:hypothetical protein
LEFCVSRVAEEGKVERRDKDNAEAQSARRFAEKREDLTPRARRKNTEGTEKKEKNRSLSGAESAGEG